jgi:hypothetical protein
MLKQRQKLPLPDEEFSPEETARRRDSVVRRMANTPPQPKISPRSEKKSKAGVDRVAHKDHARRER